MKKRALSLLLALVLLCGLLPLGALRAEAANTLYDLYIYGARVTDANKNNILGDETIRYDSVRNELIVSGELKADGWIAIDNRIPGLKIWLNANVTSFGVSCAIRSSANLTISCIGLAPVEINGKEGADGICMTDGATLTIVDADLTVNGSSAAVSGSGSEKLILKRAELKATADKAVSGFGGGIKLKDCTISGPVDYQILDGTVTEAEGDPAAYVETATDLTQYEIFVDGMPVFEQTKNDVLGDGGSVKYNPKTKTLTLNNPDFSGRAGWILVSEIDGLTIKGSAVCRGIHPYGTWILSKTKIDGDFIVSNTTYEDDIGAAIMGLGPLEFAGGKIQLVGTEFALYTVGGLRFSGGNVLLDAVLTVIYSTTEIEFGSGLQLEGLEPEGDCTIYHLNENGTSCWICISNDGELMQRVRITMGNPFVDVKQGSYYYNAVLWAVSHKPYQVTAGIDSTHFGPDKTVTRAQAMVFFWAAKDRPKFKTASTQFVDVKKTDWYYKAVMWAVEKGITAGTDATHFSPNKTCNRGEILTFLYAAMNKPKVKISNPYKDVTNQWYKKAALWAYENGIERGENGKFNAATACTRASTVTYLYRFLERKDLVE